MEQIPNQASLNGDLGGLMGIWRVEREWRESWFSFGMRHLQLNCSSIEAGEAPGNVVGGLPGRGGRGRVGRGGFEVLIPGQCLPIGRAGEFGAADAVFFRKGEDGGGAGGEGFADVGIDRFKVIGQVDERRIQSAIGDGEEKTVGNVRADLANEGQTLFGSVVFEAQHQWLHAGDQVFAFRVFESAEHPIALAGCK
jgi:hypothetical protein